VIDSEGDYAELENTVSLGDAKHEPRLQEAVELLRDPKENLVVNLLGVQLDEPPRYFAKLFPQLCQLRAETARPAGLLHHRRVTTHWMFSWLLATAYPSIQVDSNLLFARDGNIYSSGGITAGIDLALALVEEDLGREIALATARTMVDIFIYFWCFTKSRTHP